MLIHIENFYDNPENIFNIISKLEFKENLYGEEIKDFNMISPDIANIFSAIVGQKISLSKNSGSFRKPYSPVHFESFDENSLFVGFIALEDTNFKTYKHKETGFTNVFPITKDMDIFIKNNCFDLEKWETIADIKLLAGSLLLIKPWIWHGLDKKIVKVFYLEKTINDN